MTIEELIEELELLKEQYGAETEVRLGADYGDYCHTLQALDAVQIVPVQLCESAYSRSGYAVITHDDPTDETDHSMDDPEHDMVILISSEYINR
jgi:hypothetical protein